LVDRAHEASGVDFAHQARGLERGRRLRDAGEPALAEPLAFTMNAVTPSRSRLARTFCQP
jgi:hypothetical protein